jgi:prepilin peptidase CpaA
MPAHPIKLRDLLRISTVNLIDTSKTGIELCLLIALSALLLAATFTDLKSQRIPNYLTLPGMIVAQAFYSTANGLDGFLFSTAGMATGIALLFFPYIMGGMGAGDVKLMGAVGSFLGAKATLGAFLFIALAGGIYSLAIILIRRDMFKGFFGEKLLVLSSIVMLRQYVPIENGNTGQKLRLKYGVAIAFGTITYLVTKALGIKFLRWG